METNSSKTNLDIRLDAELKISAKPIKFKLSTVGGNHSLFKGIITSEESIKIKDLVNAFEDNLGESIPDDIAITLDQLLLVLNKEKTTTKLLIGLGLGTEINLSNLPLIGKKFSPEQTVAIKNFQLIYTSQTFDNQNQVIKELPQKNIEKGIALSALMQFGEQQEILDIAITKNKEQKQEEKKEDKPKTENPQEKDISVSLPEVTTDDGTKWFKLKKQFGPVYFQRVGVKYQNSEVWFLLDASISSSGMTLALYGLSVGSSITKFQPKFNLQGLGISYESKGAVAIGGAFLRTITPQGKDEYSGALIIKTEAFTLSAIGSYTTTEEGHPSLFIYGILDKPIGGLSFFFITGLALGFGYNRSLILPTLDQIPEFPLVKAALNSAEADLTGLTQIQKELTPFIPPKTGEIFLAIGIKFTSFKIIDSFALLIATFGDQFTLNLIGISTLISPPVIDENIEIPPLAKVRFALLARFVPAEGTIKVDGKILPDSYIFDKNCTISGGFAFYSWFKGEHEGDFVLTVGGYHPKFDIPDHYPRVDPLALNWQISPELSVKGSVYFALTASAIMAGGRLEAIWQSENLKAWYIINANFIVAWQPYFYDAEISLRIGASYTFDVDLWFTRIRKTISVDLGANLHIWGPEFSGTATVDLKIISFTITFGSRTQKKPDPLNWTDFKKSFLPADNQICTLAIESGLLRKVENEEIFIVNPKEFVITTSSVIPIKTSNTGKGENVNSFGIAPMNVNSSNFTQSEYNITINNIPLIDQKDKFSSEPSYKNIPTGLWAESNSNDFNRERFINNVLSGFTIKPANPPKPGKTQAIECKNLAYDIESVNNACQWNKSFSKFSSILNNYKLDIYFNYKLDLYFFQMTDEFDLTVNQLIIQEFKNLIMLAEINNFYYVTIFDASSQKIVDKQKIPEQKLFAQLDKNQIDFQNNNIKDQDKQQIIKNLLLSLDYMELEIIRTISNTEIDTTRKKLLSAFPNINEEIKTINLQDFSLDKIEQSFIIAPQLTIVII